MDAQEWSKMADKLAQVRSKSYNMQMDAEEYDTEVYHEAAFIRELLYLCLIRIDKLAKWDDKGWIK